MAVVHGQGRMTGFATGGRARNLDFETGDVGYVQKALPHDIEITGKTDLKFLEMFRSIRFQDLSLSEWMTHPPPELLRVQLNSDKAILAAIPRESHPLVPA